MDARLRGNREGTSSAQAPGSIDAGANDDFRNDALTWWYAALTRPTMYRRCSQNVQTSIRKIWKILYQISRILLGKKMNGCEGVIKIGRKKSRAEEGEQGKRFVR